MSCAEVRSLLALFVGGDAGADERVAVEGHMAMCPACAAELEEYREALAALRSGLPEPERAPDLADRILVALRARRFAWIPRLAGWSRWAAVFLIGAGLGILAQGLWPGREPAPPDVPVVRVNRVAPGTLWHPQRGVQPAVSGGSPGRRGRPGLIAPAELRVQYLPHAEVLPARSGWTRM